MSTIAVAPDSNAAVALLWDAVSGVADAAAPLPVGIVTTAARHRMVLPLYRAGGNAERLSAADRSLARAFANYSRRRAEAYLHRLREFSAQVPQGWLTWKAGALLASVASYPPEFEAADVDILVTPAAAEAWIAVAAPDGATRRRTTDDGRLASAQIEVPLEPDLQLVWDVKVIDDLPPYRSDNGVPVAFGQSHHALLEAHLEHHLADADGCRLRMFHDARIAGAPWAQARVARWLEDLWR